MISRSSRSNVLVTTLAAAVALIGAAFTTGCGDDSSSGTYCSGNSCCQTDSNGNYVCTEPTDASISVGTYGGDDASTTVVNEDAGSAGDDETDGGVVVADASTSGNGDGSVGTGDAGASCSGGFASCSTGFACNAGTCTACGGSAGPCPCNTNAECGTDANGSATECVQNACTPKASVCQYQSDCASGDVCEDGQCVVACTTSCASGTCSKGGCVPTPSGSACNDDTTCSGGFCVAGHCAAACGGDAAACASGTTCIEGACLANTAPASECTGDSQCAGNGQTCIGGLCKYSCTTDSQCEHIDNRIGYCGADNVCRDSTEAHPACRTKFDCAPGLDCVNNACQ